VGAAPRWTLATVGLIALVTLGARLDWESSPRFLDSYYHLAVIQGFQHAGGVALHAFWEAAPEGRPHLYPPLFHLVWAPVWWVTRDPITVARLWSLLSAPLLLLGVAWASRILGGARRASLTVAAMLIPAGLYRSTLIHPTASLALIGVLGVWVLLERRQVLAGGLLLGLVGWLHPAIPWVTLLALGLLAITHRAYRHALAIAGIGLTLMAPWWLHVSRHLGTLHWLRQPEAQHLELSPAFIALGAAGLLLTRRHHLAYRFPVALLVAALPWAGLYPYRLLSAQGLVPLGLLAGLALDAGCQRWVRLDTARWQVLSSVVALGLLLTVSPTVMVQPRRPPAVSWGDTGLITAVRGVPLGRGHLEALYDERHFAPLAQHLRRWAAADDLLFCNFPYMGGLFSVLTGLATTTSMVAEAGRQPWDEALAHARWILWLKMPADLDPLNDATAQRLADGRSWRLALETPIAFLYEAPEATPPPVLGPAGRPAEPATSGQTGGGATGRRTMRGTVIPWWLAYGVLAAIGVALWWVLLRWVLLRRQLPGA